MTEPILIEFNSGEGVQPVSLRGFLARTPEQLAELAAKSEHALDSAMNTIKSMAERVNNTIDAITDPPKDIEVTFGLKLDAEAGAYIAKSGVEASFQVKMVWKREPAGARPAANGPH